VSCSSGQEVNTEKLKKCDRQQLPNRVLIGSFVFVVVLIGLFIMCVSAKRDKKRLIFSPNSKIKTEMSNIRITKI
jgi:hypothetical protein